MKYLAILAIVGVALTGCIPNIERFPNLTRHQKIYDSSECIGPIIMGVCHGAILPKQAYHPTCHGTWLNNQCTGPMF